MENRAGTQLELGCNGKTIAKTMILGIEKEREFENKS
jgi:hypothetical protein